MTTAVAPTPALQRDLYRRMQLIHTVERRIAEIYHLQEMRCPVHLYLGQEAVAAGVCAALQREDLVFPYYRSHGWYLAKGGDLNAMMAELYGRTTGCSKGWGGSMHLIDIAAGVMGASAIVAGMISHAAGAALALQMQGRDAVALVPFGDAAIEEGVFHETMNFAALHKLPIVFLCENNLYAVNTLITDRQAQTDIYTRAASYGLPGTLVDGNDVMAVHQAAVEAVDRARRGDGPSLVECRTYRFLEHCGPNEDLDLGYRSADEVQAWADRGPLVQGSGLVSEAERVTIVNECESLMESAIEFARSSPFPDDIFAGQGR